MLRKKFCTLPESVINNISKNIFPNFGNSNKILVCFTMRKNCVVLKGYPELYLFIFYFNNYRIGKEQQKEATRDVLGYLSITPVRRITVVYRILSTVKPSACDFKWISVSPVLQQEDHVNWNSRVCLAAK